MENDRIILRELAKEYAEIADLGVQKQTRDNWRKLNSLKSAKPTILLDEICWHEFSACDELKLTCTDGFNRSLEWQMREQIYRWKHFRADMVVPKMIRIGKSYTDTGYGVGSVVQDETDYKNAQTHLYADQLPDEESLNRLHFSKITYNKESTEANKLRAEELVGDILPVHLSGSMLWMAVWDRIVFWRGAEPSLYSLVDDPDYVHKLMAKMTAIESDRIDQLEAQNLLDAGPSLCHAKETYLDEPLPDGFDENHIRASDCWISGAAQIFSEVSPAMHDEFEIEYLKPLYERFGWVYYGCCEPLHNKIDIISKIKNVRAISVSPWADVETAAAAMGNKYVMSNKPNPAFVASGYVDAESVKSETRKVLKECYKNNTPLEFILKDITTINNRPDCLHEWYELVKSEIESY